MLGSLLLGGAPLGSIPGASSAPVMVGGPLWLPWSARLMVAGVDWSARLTGELEVDQEEGSASVCVFTLVLPAGSVFPAEWRGREVVADYIDTNGEQRLFTGRIVDPVWSRTTRTLRCTCSDGLQDRVEAMEIEAIDTLVGGLWSADVFEPTEGRSRWDYAQERLSTVVGALDCAPDGSLRVTSWYAKNNPDYVFGADSTVYDTMDVQLSENARETNQVEIDAAWRFPRLRQFNASYAWSHSLTDGFSGEQGFCAWLVDAADTPTVEMVLSAISGSGQTLLGGASWVFLPPSGIYCIPPLGWVNLYTDLLLGAAFTGARRWAQSVTEQTRLIVQAPAAIAAAGEVVVRDSLAVEVGGEAAELWESTPFGVNSAAPAVGRVGAAPVVSAPEAVETPGRPVDNGADGHTDLREEPRRQLDLRIKLHQAVRTITGDNRSARVSWQTPAAWVPGLDVRHTVALDDQGVRAQCKVFAVSRLLSFATGEAMATISIVRMSGGGDVNDPLTPPAGSEEPQPEDEGGVMPSGLPTQIGGRGEEYDDTLDGFSGSWAVGDGISEGFPRRFQITAPEVPAEIRDERVVPIEAVYRVAIPTDLLELY